MTNVHSLIKTGVSQGSILRSPKVPNTKGFFPTCFLKFCYPSFVMIFNFYVGLRSTH